MPKIKSEQDAFTAFKFQIGQPVIHRASGALGVVTGRILVQAQTGNTGHMYEVSTGEKYNKRYEIELSDRAER
jgi:hypothetical protein